MAVLQHTTVVPTTIALCCAEAGRKRATSSMKTTSGITAGFRLCLLAIAAVLLSVLKTPLPAATAFVSMSPRFIVQQQGGDTHATARGDRGRRWDARARCKLAAASLRGRKGDGAVSSRNALASAVEVRGIMWVMYVLFSGTLCISDIPVDAAVVMSVRCSS